MNHDILVVRDGEEALTFVETLEAESGVSSPILMLLDLHLPKMDGLQVLRRLRLSRRGARIPVMILTSSDSPHEREVVEGFEKVSFFRKPGSLEEYLALGAIAKGLIGGAQGNALGASAGTAGQKL